MTNKAKPLSWIPVVRGAIYCSPACGHQCTKSAFDKATHDAEALVKKLGLGWKPRVWENLGWHYCAITTCGRWKVHTAIRGGKIEGYTAFLGEDSLGGRWARSGSTPRKAIRSTRDAAKAEFEIIRILLDIETGV